MVQIYTDQNIPFVQSWEQRAVVLHLSANNAQTNGTNRLAGLISLILAYSKNVLDIVSYCLPVFYILNCRHSVLPCTARNHTKNKKITTNLKRKSLKFTL
jgi:hypothetical protein